MFGMDNFITGSHSNINLLSTYQNFEFIEHDVTEHVDFKGDFLDNVQLEIFDLMGRRIVSEKMDVKANFSTSLIDLSKSPDGHYIVKVKTDNGIYIEELIKQ